MSETTQLARGIMAAVQLRLLAGRTDATYSPDDVAKMVSEVIDEQVARIEHGDCDYNGGPGSDQCPHGYYFSG